MRDYGEHLNKGTLEQIESSPDYKERWISEHNDRVVSSFIREMLPIQRVIEIYFGLQHGKSYTPKSRNKDTWYNMTIIYDEVAKEKVIAWHNHGSSANKNTIDDLFWLIHTIFDGEDFYEYTKEAGKEPVFSYEN
jgi:hypothetical protein